MVEGHKARDKRRRSADRHPLFDRWRVAPALVLLISLGILSSIGLLPGNGHLAAAPLAIISEGVSLVGADAWHQAGFRGQGVKIAVLDAGFRDYEARIGQGELPTDVITHTFRTVGGFGAGDEHGTVMAEIAFDLAPQAQFYLVNTLPTDVG
ncbi:MAG: hypothetical protein D6791_05665, partial [Chloroflexi bacterium]